MYVRDPERKWHARYAGLYAGLLQKELRYWKNSQRVRLRFWMYVKKTERKWHAEQLDELLDYIKENYDIEKIVNELIDYLYIVNPPDDIDPDDKEFVLPIIAWLESDRREREAVVLLDTINDNFPFALTSIFWRRWETIIYLLM